MSWLSLIAGLSLPCCAGYALACSGTRNLPPTGAIRVLRLCLAAGIGVGLSSCTWFLWLAMFGAPHAMYQVTEAVFCLLIAFVCRQAPVTDAPALTAPRNHLVDEPRCRSPITIPIACLFALVLFSAIAGIAGETLAHPHGGWDAWAIWNLRAKFLFALGDDWRAALSGRFDHGDYPLLVPATLARCWSLLGTDDAAIGVALGIGFTGLTVTTCIAAVAHRAGLSSGLLAGTVLLGTVRLLRWGAAQYADVPLAFFFLATSVLLVLADEHRNGQPSRPRGGLLFLAGLTAGLAAWTKNEGLLFAAVVLAARPAVVWFQRGWRRGLRESLFVLAGAAPVLILVAGFKIQVPLANDLIAGQHAGASLSRVLDPARHGMILAGLAGSASHVVHGFLAVLPACFVLLGRNRRAAGAANSLLFPTAALGLMLAGYYAIYLTTPHDLAWHLSSSADRLLVQLWPAAVAMTFFSLRSPDDLLATEANAVTLRLSRDAPAGADRTTRRRAA